MGLCKICGGDSLMFASATEWRRWVGMASVYSGCSGNGEKHGKQMTRRLQHLAVWIGVGVTFLLLAPRPAHPQSATEIVAALEGDGRVVFTNLAMPPTPVESPRRAVIAPERGELATAFQRTTPYDELIDGISARHGVDSTLVRAVIEVESGYDRHAVSSRGARGLMQLIPETGARFGVRDPFNPSENIEGGVRYLRHLLEMFDGNLSLSLAAYNSGENRVARLGRVPQIRETQDYVRKVQAAFRRMGGPGTRAFVPAVAVRSTPEAPRLVPPRSGITVSVDAAGTLSFTNLDSFR